MTFHQPDGSVVTTNGQVVTVRRPDGSVVSFTVR